MYENEDIEADYDDGMDGDFDSAMTSAGMGKDEDYGLFNDSWYEDQYDIGDNY